MSDYISREAASAFRRFGEGNSVESGGRILFPERIAIENGVSLQAPYRLYADSRPRPDSPTGIDIADGCRIESGLIAIARTGIRLGRNLAVGPNVLMNDADWMPRLPGSEISGKSENGAGASGEIESEEPGPDKGIVIGEGADIGANVMILGPVTVGAGSVVKPNSIVTADVPDYCVAAGRPAAVVRFYEPASGQWKEVSERGEAAALLQARAKQPLLSICIPTCNRADCLAACLESIVTQLRTVTLVEVIVSDNASTDETSRIARHYSRQYPYIKYCRNPENIGGDRNIYEVTKLASGMFVKLQGDDDYFKDGTLLPLLNALYRHSDCGLLFVNVLNGSGIVLRSEGMAGYLAATSLYAGFITSLVFRRQDLLKVKEPTRFIDTSYNQIYLQYALLEHNPRFCIMNSAMFAYAAMPPEALNFGEINIVGYQAILRHFIGRGLSEDDYRREKKNSLFRFTLPRLRRIAEGRMAGNIAGFKAIYTEHYKDEPYYEEGLAILNALPSASPPHPTRIPDSRTGG